MPASLLAAGFETAADRACPPVYASDSITCVDPGTWFEVGYLAPAAPTTSQYINDPANAHSGRWFASMTWPGGYVPGDAGWGADVYHTAYVHAPVIYMKEWLKYPTTWRWPCCGGGNEQKALILEDAPPGVRPLLSLQAFPHCVNAATNSTTCADVCTIYGANGYHCHTAPNALVYNPDGIKADGQWHSLQFFVDVPNHHGLVWLDGQLYDDDISSDIVGPINWTTAKYGFHFNAACADITGSCTYYIDDIGLSMAYIGQP